MPLPIVSNDRFSYMDESSIPSSLICKFCSKPFVEPVAINNDRFCRSCICHVLSRNSSSENDRAILNTDEQVFKMQSLTPVTEPLVLLMLDSLLVRCTKCEQINIPRGQLGEHENQECTQAPVLCEAACYKCSWQGPREELNEHREQCNFEKIRPTLEYIFGQQYEIRDRLQNLETDIDQLMNSKRFNNLNF